MGTRSNNERTPNAAIVVTPLEASEGPRPTTASPYRMDNESDNCNS
jgi:hypothetical protein